MSDGIRMSARSMQQIRALKRARTNVQIGKNITSPGEPRSYNSGQAAIQAMGSFLRGLPPTCKANRNCPYKFPALHPKMTHIA